MEVKCDCEEVANERFNEVEKLGREEISEKGKEDWKRDCRGLVRETERRK